LIKGVGRDAQYIAGEIAAGVEAGGPDARPGKAAGRPAPGSKGGAYSSGSVVNSSG
jgi:hypothetical protein